MPIADFALGGYRFIPGVFQYSGGVTALPGYEIQRVRFREPVPLALGFERIAHWLHGASRPLTSFCACELRSPAPFSDTGFRGFNESYVLTLGKWGIFDGTNNPVARSNVCPEIDPPAEPSGSPSASAPGETGTGSTATEASGKHRKTASTAESATGADTAASTSSDATSTTTTTSEDETGASGVTGDGSYTVVSGDNLSEIAKKQSVSGGWERLYGDNKDIVGNDPDLIYPGQQLDFG